MAEALTILTGLNLRPVMLLLLLSLISVILTGRFVSRIWNPMGGTLILLSGWFLLCIPTSVHKGGSVNHLLSTWVSTLLLCLCALAYAENSKMLRSMLHAIVAGTLVLMFAQGWTDALTSGGMGNPNLFGQHLLYALPLLFLVVFRHSVLSIPGLLAFSVGILLVGKVAFTGSRSALIAMCVTAAVTFLRLPISRKLIVLIVSTLLLPVGITLIPQKALQRYSTILNSDNSGNALTEEELSAIASAEARKHHLDQSIELTFSNPLFGVGPGMFQVASADLSKMYNERALWKETHNSYTQISSETGLPGLAFYLLIIALTAKSLWRTFKNGRHTPVDSELGELSLIAGTLLLSLLSMMITGMFSSSAYMTYFPLLGCLAYGAARLSAASLAQKADNTQPTSAKPLTPFVARPLRRPLSQARPEFRA